MSLIDEFPEHLRDLFEQTGETIEIARGAHLLRRGEPGGDVYLVRDGQLEVVDTRTVPEVILVTLGPNSVVGDMAFVDNSPRSADVRASTDVVVTRWARDDLRALFAREPELAASFFESIARLAAARLRRLTNEAVFGALHQPANAAAGPGAERVQSEAMLVAERAKEGLLLAESQLNQREGAEGAGDALAATLNRLELDVNELFQAHPDLAESEEASRLLSRELHPYLMRSALGARCIRRRQGVTGTAEAMAHVLVNAAAGDGPLGEVLDRWLLARPTNRAQRSFRPHIARLVEDALPRHRNRRVLVVNASTGSLIAELVSCLSHPPTVITVVDQSRDALAFLDAGVDAKPGIQLEAHQENLAQFAMGGQKRSLPPQDAVVLHGLIEYMPDRIATSLLEVARDLLTPHGTIVLTALAPSPDEHLMSWLLGWPTVRRSREALRRITRAAKLTVTSEPVTEPPALIATATRA